MHQYYQGNTRALAAHIELSRQTAFHEAGHAAAIYLGNKQKNLPSIYFSIQTQASTCADDRVYASINDGRLVGDLASATLKEIVGNPDSAGAYGFQLACEADMINFFAGSLAEAKYLAIRDKEIFNIRSLTPQTLIYYGGTSDIHQVSAYLEFLISSPKQREATLNQLFAEAFHFVQQAGNWQSITALAHFILENPGHNISCEQAIEILDRPYVHKPRPLDMSSMTFYEQGASIRFMSS